MTRLPGSSRVVATLPRIRAHWEVTHGKKCTMRKYYKRGVEPDGQEVKLWIVDLSEYMAGLTLTKQDYAPEPDQFGEIPELDRWDKYVSKDLPRSPGKEGIDPKPACYDDRWFSPSRIWRSILSEAIL